MSQVLQWVTALAGPVGVLLGVAGKGWFDRTFTVASTNKIVAEDTKIDSEAAQIIANTAVSLVAPLKTQIEELTSRVEALETENTETKTRLQLAISYIRSLRSWIQVHIPDRTPPAPPTGLDI